MTGEQDAGTTQIVTVTGYAAGPLDTEFEWDDGVSTGSGFEGPDEALLDYMSRPR